MINGVSELAMMKADVLSGMETIQLCTHYKVNGQLTDRLPYDISGTVEPVYTTVPGWGELSVNASLPEALEAYIRTIETATVFQ